jgi:hypothetical protein
MPVMVKADCQLYRVIQICIRGDKINPPTPLPANIMPKARPLLSLNQFDMDTMRGIYIKMKPVPLRTPKAK